MTDAGLTHLAGLTKLTYLNLRLTHITDAGLAHLNGLTNLSALDLSATQVTSAGVTELRRVLPKASAYR